MSFRFPSEAPAGPLLDEQHVVEQARNREDREWALLPVEDVTVSLLERVAADAFSERLFYRLNIIHLMAAAGAPDVTLT